MQGQQRDRWMELCLQALSEQDPDRFLKLIREINDLLEEKERHLGILPSSSAAKSGVHGESGTRSD